MTGPDRRPGEGAASPPLPSRQVFRPRNVASFLLALAVLYLAYRELLGFDWREAWASVQAANAGLFALAFALFYCMFPLRALRWKTLLGNVGYNRAAMRSMPSTLGLTRIMYLGWFANCLVTARLGDAYRSYLLKKVAGVSFAVTFGTVVAERILDLTVLAALMCASVLVFFGGSLPAEPAQVLIAGLVLSAIGVGGLLVMLLLRGTVERVLPKRLYTHYSRLEHGVVGSVRQLPLLVSYSAVGWVIEGATLYTVVVAVGTQVPVTGALMVALAASLLTTVPFTPAGLGFTEAGMVIMLGWLGLDAPTAAAATLLFRVINYWSIVVLGFALYVISRKGDRLAGERDDLHG